MLKLITSFLLICHMATFSLTAQSDTPQFNLTPEEKHWLTTHSEVTLALDGYFPPYSFLNEAGQIEGFTVDIFKLITDKTGLSFNLHPEHEWNLLYQSAKDKRVDVVATMVNLPDRQKWFNFSQPYVHKSLVIVTQNSNTEIQKKNDIAGKRLALVKGYQYVSELLSTYPDIKPIYVDTLLDALEAVAIGDADATISFLGTTHYYRNKYALGNLNYALFFDKKNASESIAVRHDWPELASILTKALQSIPEQQKLELLQKWLPFEYVESLAKISFTAEEQTWLNQHKPIRLGIDPEFAPFEYIEDGVYKGISSDYVALLNERLGIQIEVVPNLSWEQVIDKARQGEIDVLAAVGKTEERQSFLNYTLPYLKFHRVIVTRENMPFISGLDDLKGMSIAVQDKSSHHGFLKDKTDIKPVICPTQQECLLALSGGETDAFIGNVASATYWIKTLALSNLKIAAPLSTEVQNLHFAVRKDWPELVSILEKGLSTIPDKHKNLIADKWLDIQHYPYLDFALIGKLIALFSVIVISILLWNWSLQKRVKQHTEELAHSLSHDHLTKLPNRVLITKTLSQIINEAQHHNSTVALFSLDIDDFKKINDVYGHKIGDTLLQQFSQLLKQILPSHTYLGRFGGDQFLIIYSHFDDVSDIIQAAKSMAQTINNKFEIESHEHTLTTSVGIALFPTDGKTADDLVRHADIATHYTKRHQPGGFTFYTRELNQQIARRLELEHYINQALQEDEFEVYFQPKVEANTKLITGFEALVRWQSEQLGTVSPAEFIPIAERTGLIDDIGIFVIEQALSNLAFIQRRYGKAFSVAINLSPKQFNSDSFFTVTQKAMAANKLNGNAIEFEITEGILLSEHIDVDRTLEKLDSLGVLLAMDDFGTGYSSLNYLRKYRFDTLKIDREFIADLSKKDSSHKLVAATILIAHSLDMKVVAEGVETEEQATILTEQGCDFLQGWLFSKALPIKELLGLLDQQYKVQDKQFSLS